MSIKVSFIIPHKGRAQLLIQTIDSIVHQNFDLSLVEIIIVTPSSELDVSLFNLGEFAMLNNELWRERAIILSIKDCRIPFREIQNIIIHIIDMILFLYSVVNFISSRCMRGLVRSSFLTLVFPSYVLHLIALSKGKGEARLWYIIQFYICLSPTRAFGTSVSFV